MRQCAQRILIESIIRQNGSAGTQAHSIAAGMVIEVRGMSLQWDIGQNLVRRVGKPHQKYYYLEKRFVIEPPPIAQSSGFRTSRNAHAGQH